MQENKDALNITSPQAREREPEPEELLSMATAALERQDWAAAEGFLVKLNRCYPDLLEPYLILGDVLTLQGKQQGASEIWQAAQQLAPEDVPLLKRLGLNRRQRWSQHTDNDHQ